MFRTYLNGQNAIFNTVRSNTFIGVGIERFVKCHKNAGTYITVQGRSVFLRPSRVCRNLDGFINRSILMWREKTVASDHFESFFFFVLPREYLKYSLKVRVYFKHFEGNVIEHRTLL